MMMFAPRRFSRSAHLLRAAAVSALFAATVIATPLIGAIAADDAASPTGPAKATSHHTGSTGAWGKRETIDQRIASLHKSLKITADEETAWTVVAQAMRENDAAMQKLVATNNADHAKNISAVEDLKIYASFTQAHIDGLNNLIPAFESLYASMPDSQKAVADQVFQRFGHKANTSVATK